MVGMKPLLNIISWNLSSDGDGSFKMFILKSPRIYTFLPFSFERIRSYASLNSSSDAFGGRYITPTTVGSCRLVMDTNSDSMCSLQRDKPMILFGTTLSTKLHTLQTMASLMMSQLIILNLSTIAQRFLKIAKHSP